jgi:hypothetical protein
MHEDMNHVSDAFPTGIDDDTRSSPALPYALIQRSAWKGNSPKLDFGLKAFSEVRNDNPHSSNRKNHSFE